MPYSRLSLLTSVCIAALTWGAARPAVAEPLEEAVAAALSQHPSINSAEAGRDALTQDVREKRSDYYPQLSVEAIGGRIYGDNATSRGLSVTRGNGYSGYGEGSVTMTQPIFNGFQTGNRVSAATARRDSADFKVADTREDLALRATLSYLDVLRGRESVDKLRAYGKTLDSYIARIEKMVKEGGADAALKEQARDVRSQLDNTLAASEGQLQSAIATYTELIGHAPAEELMKPAAPLAMIPDTAADAVAYALDHHPTLKAAELTEQAAEMDRKAEVGAYYPALNGQLSYLKSDERDLLGGELVDARAVLKMNWNYAVGGAEQARVRRAVLQRQQSRDDLENLERQVTRRIEVAYSEDATSAEQARIQRQRVEINEGLFKTQQQQFEGGKVNLLQLEQSDNNLFNARLSLMNNEYKVLASKYTILATMSRLQDALTAPPDSHLQSGPPVESVPVPAVPEKSAPAKAEPEEKTEPQQTPATPISAPAPVPPHAFAPPAESLLYAPALVHAPPQTVPVDSDDTPSVAPLTAQPGEAVKPALAPQPDISTDSPHAD